MDSHTLQALIDGDDMAWEQFYSEMVPLIRGVGVVEAPNLTDEDLDDLVQIVCEKLINNDYEALRAFNPELDMKPYMITIALNAARDMAGQAHRWREIPVGGSSELELIESQRGMHRDYG